MVFIPHGLDATFRTPNLSIDAPTNSVVGRAVFETSEGRRLYGQRLRTFHPNFLNPAVISNRLEKALGRLRAARLSEPELAGITRRITVMNLRITQRAARLGELLAGREPAALPFDETARGRPEGWHEELVIGEPVLDQSSACGTVGLRISGEPEYRRLDHALQWQELAHEFEVKVSGRDIDLVCEFDAYDGTAWFDLDSLFVRKL